MSGTRPAPAALDPAESPGATPDPAQAGAIAVLTRPAGQAAGLAARLAQAGWQACVWPALELTALEADRVPLPQEYDLVIFVSGNAVRFYTDQLAARQPEGTVWPLGVPAATVGPASAGAVGATLGAAVEVVRPPADAAAFDSEALWGELLRRGLTRGRVLIVRGGEGAAGQGRGWLAQRLAEAGADVSLHAAYRRRPAPWPQARAQRIHEWCARGVHPVWLLSSRQGVEAVYANLGQEFALDAWRGCRLVVPHERIAAAIAADAARCGIATGEAGGGARGADSHRIVIKVCMPHDDAVLAAIVN